MGVGCGQRWGTAGHPWGRLAGWQRWLGAGFAVGLCPSCQDLLFASCFCPVLTRSLASHHVLMRRSQRLQRSMPALESWCCWGGGHDMTPSIEPRSLPSEHPTRRTTTVVTRPVPQQTICNFQHMPLARAHTHTLDTCFLLLVHHIASAHSLLALPFSLLFCQGFLLSSAVLSFADTCCTCIRLPHPLAQSELSKSRHSCDHYAVVTLWSSVACSDVLAYGHRGAGAHRRAAQAKALGGQACGQHQLQCRCYCRAAPPLPPPPKRLEKSCAAY